jgi:hypothetical protein
MKMAQIKSRRAEVKTRGRNQALVLTPVIPVTQEAEIRRIKVQSQSGK